MFSASLKIGFALGLEISSRRSENSERSEFKFQALKFKFRALKFLPEKNP